jgi:fructose-bisphosphate aldolase class II
MIANLREVLNEAENKGIAIPAFNTFNLEVTKAIIEAAEELASPVIVATTEKAIEYAGLEELASLLTPIAERAKVPVVIHLDHGKSFEIILKVIRYGWTSVMIDGSEFPYRKNVSITRSVVEVAHPVGVSVEGELGRIMGVEDDVSVEGKEAFFTDPEEAKRFVEETGIDALAVAVGTAHGPFKFEGEPELDLERIESIYRITGIPLVLHGASKVPSEIVDEANHFGASIKGTSGVPDRILYEAVKRGVRKVNTDTDLRLAFTAGLRRYFAENPGVFDPRKYLGYAIERVKEVVKDRIKVLRGEF